MRKITQLTPLTWLILPAALLAAGPLLSNTGTLKAQGSLECIYCEDVPGPEHWTWPFFAPRHGYGPGDGIHWETRYGYCDYVHGICVFVPRGGTRTLTALELTREISDAVQEGDIARLAEYANIPSVSLYADRSAIQVLSCDGESIAGHIPVHRDILRAIEAEAMELLDPDA